VSDAEEFGKIVDKLVGCECERSLATNSIKLRFKTRIDPRGKQYIWIDPPWQRHGPIGLATSSAEYDDARFEEWSAYFAPLDRTVLTSWRVTNDRGVVFEFVNGYRSILPPSSGKRRKEDWYSHWYARDHESKLH
jgi:hypothetical protein